MEGVIFTGIQASGKSTFYKDRFFRTHVRINLDQVKTRNRERRLLNVCLETGQPVVIDNTNPALEDRARYIARFKEYGFKVVGYYFESKIEQAKERNSSRVAKEVVPLPGLLATYKRLVLPSLAEGFDELYYVKIEDSGSFRVEPWSEEAENEI